MKFKAVFQNVLPDRSVPLSELKTGQIGVLTESNEEFTVGYLVQWSSGRTPGTRLCAVGGDASYWSGVGPDSGASVLSRYRVRILADGDKLVAGKHGGFAVEWAERELSVPLTDLRDGQVAEVTEFDGRKTGAYAGALVERAPWGGDPEGSFRFVGCPSERDGLFRDSRVRSGTRVRVLRPGDRIEVVE